MLFFNRSFLFGIFVLFTLAACGGGSSSGGDSPLTFSQITPSAGYFPGQQRLTITGAGFDSAVSVSIGGEPCINVTIMSDTTLRCISGNGAPGTANVVLANCAETAVGTNAFTYLDFTKVITIAGTGTPGAANGAGDVAEFSSAVNDLNVVGDLLYVADGTNYQVRVIDLSQLDPNNPQPVDVTVSTLAGTGTMGMEDSSDGTGSTAQFRQPDDVGAVGNGFLYVTDTDWASFAITSAVRQIDLFTGETTTNHTSTAIGLGGIVRGGGNNFFMTECSSLNTVQQLDVATFTATDFVGSAGQSGDETGVGSAARFNCPYDLQIDTGGENMFLVDYDNDRIRKIEIATATVTNVAGDGTSGSFDAPDGLAAQFDSPNKIAFTPNYLFVTDYGNCTVRQIDLVTTAVTTLAGTAGICTPSSNAPLTTATFGSVGGVAYHPDFGLFVSTTDYGWAAGPTDASIQLIH